MSEIAALLPHRPPFLFVDRLQEATTDKTVGFKRFLESEFFFAGHFPEYPVVPGVILVECLAQCGGAGYVQASGGYDGSISFLASVEKAKFRRQVRPGDELRMEVTNLRTSATVLRQSGKGYVNGELAVEAQWMCLRSKEA